MRCDDGRYRNAKLRRQISSESVPEGCAFQFLDQCAQLCFSLALQSTCREPRVIIPKLIQFTLFQKFLKFLVGVHDKVIGIPWRFVSRDTLASF
jgi:hypothetical protein